MRAASLIALCLVLGCSSSNEPSSTTPTGDAATDGAPPSVGDVESWAEIDGSGEGIAFGVRNGAPVLYLAGSDRILRIKPDGTSELHADLKGVVGIAVRANGNIVACAKAEGAAATSDMPGAIWEVDPAGAKKLLIGPTATLSYKLTNFVAVAPDDSLVFTDSGANKVYRANADGTNVTLVDDTIVYANGLAFGKDKTLYVASWSQKKVYALPFTGGTYGKPTVAVDGIENVDGLAVGASGDLYLVCSGLGLQRVRAGKAEVVAPGSKFKLPANGAFGVGPYGDWLYVSSLIGMTVYRVWVGEGGAPLPAR